MVNSTSTTQNARAYNISSGELASLAGVNRSTAWRYLTGKSKRPNAKLEQALRDIINQRRAMLAA